MKNLIVCFAVMMASTFAKAENKNIISMAFTDAGNTSTCVTSSKTENGQNLKETGKCQQMLVQYQRNLTENIIVGVGVGFSDAKQISIGWSF